MKKILILLLMIGLSSCEPTIIDTSVAEDATPVINFKTIKVEGCDYLYSYKDGPYVGRGFLAHKGNCKNPIHECK